MYDVERGTVRWELPIARFAPNWMQFSPDGKTLYVADIYERQMFQTWDMQTGRMTSEVAVTLDWLDGVIDRTAWERACSRSANVRLKTADMTQQGEILLGMRIDFANEKCFSMCRRLLVLWRPDEPRPTAAVNLPVWDIHVQQPFRILIDHRFVQIDREWWGVRP